MFVKGEDFLGVVTTTPQNRYGGTQELQFSGGYETSKR